MSTTVLVAYATRYGSTQEVAETIAAALREGGLEVDLQPMRNVRTLEGYGAVVLGAPLYIGHWHKDALRFLSKHQDALAARPVAIFALGPIATGSEEEFRGSRTSLHEDLATFPWLTPVAVEMFGGKYDPARLRFPDSLLARLPATPLKGVPAGDLRDWPAIRAWARSLAEWLQPALSPE